MADQEVGRGRRELLAFAGWVSAALLVAALVAFVVGFPPVWKRVTLDVTERSPVEVVAFLRQQTGASITIGRPGGRPIQLLWPPTTVTFAGQDVPVEVALQAVADAYGGRVRRVWRGWNIEEPEPVLPK